MIASEVRPPANRARPTPEPTPLRQLARRRGPCAARQVVASCKLRRGLAGTSARQDRAANMALPHLEPQRASARISYDTTFPCELWNSTLSMKTNRPPTVRGYVNLNAPRTSLPRTQRGNLATKHEAWVLPEIRFN